MPTPEARRFGSPQDIDERFRLLVESVRDYAIYLLDANGYVLGGIYVDFDGTDVSQDIGAQLSGISEEVLRAMRHLDIGDWQAITFETHAAVVAMAPETDGALVVVAASRMSAFVAGTSEAIRIVIGGS